jgi:hypothetical protein
MDSLRLVGKAVAWGVCLLLFLSLFSTGVVVSYVHLENVKSPSNTAATASQLLPEARVTLAEIESLTRKMKQLDALDAPSYSSQWIDAWIREKDLQEQMGAILNRFCGDAVMRGCYLYSTISGTDEEVIWAKEVVGYLEQQSNPKHVFSNNLLRIPSLLMSILLMAVSGYIIYVLSKSKTLNIRNFVMLLILTIPVLMSFLYGSLYVVAPGETSLKNLSSDWYRDIVLGVVLAYPFLVLPPIYVLMKKSGVTLKSLVFCSRQS